MKKLLALSLLTLFSCGETETVTLKSACDNNTCVTEENTYVLPPSVNSCAISGYVVTCNDGTQIEVNVEVTIEDNDSIEIEVQDNHGRKHKRNCRKHRR